MNENHDRVDKLCAELSRKLFWGAEQSLKRRGLKGKALDVLLAECMANDELRTQLFRFIDVFPALKNDQSIVSHFLSYLGPHQDHFPWFIKKALYCADKPIACHAVAGTIKWLVKFFAGHFVIDSVNEQAIIKKCFSLRSKGYDTTWDILGEDSLTQKEADNFTRRYFDLIERLGSMPAPREFTNNISIKLSSLVPKFQWDPIDFDNCARAVSKKFREVLRAGIRQRVTINVDMEQYAARDLTLAIFKDALSAPEFDGLDDAGIVVQAYLKDSADSLDDLLSWIKERKINITIRLVKGAYWDHEVINAEQQGWPIPVFTDKAETDRQFKLLTEKILLAQKSGVPVKFAAGSHNIDSLSYAIALMRELGLDGNRNEIQVLHGMGDHIREAVLDVLRSAQDLRHATTCHVRVYAPYGELVPSMAYLVRRLLENTSQQSFLGVNFLSKKKHDSVSGADDVENLGRDVPKINKRALVPDGYKPEPLTDFSKKENRDAMQKVLTKIRGEFNQKYPLIIGEERVFTEDLICSKNPACFGEDKAIGYVSRASREHAKRALIAAERSFADWNAVSVKERLLILLRAADIIRSRRLDLAAWQIFEASKTWREADADVAEAIDFLEYYARMAEYLMAYQSTEELRGEANECGYEGRGITIVISPWNFPMAIAAGMCSAALVSGNTVIFKPASATVVSGYKIAEIFLEAGVPSGVLNFLPGSGNELGDTLVKYRGTTNILFTGSKKVGFKLFKMAADAGEAEQTHVRRVIAEMGGKNAVIVDETADLDQAVYSVIKSAFGYQGQKCSACSRVIVLDPIYDEFVERLRGAVASLRIGMPDGPGTDVAAVIDEAAFHNIKQYIEIGKKDSRLAHEADIGDVAGKGWFIGPIIFTDVLPESIIAQEEIFGPVLAVIRAANFKEAVQIANNSVYRLTGGVYSRTDEHLDYARKYFKAGNLYINRHITGAIVGRQPFGGFGASGSGPKAGGPDYLMPLMESRTVTECLIRRGFSPKLKN
ncbi:MAG: bifunctional proline dehydrogenase/L-glutamate gamma-semialdehyde dehydrogenase [Candidatus Niyogibacteria bacterium]|nr:bifunctional proline dehydrogenase/L-glutamate gamma-semialdehyde dehydrogenase [Candidatus Niyogibacteria bacterium]